jgi:V/A-type H+-transporting ATPase subunit E
MGLDKVVEEVLSSGRERRDGILADAKEEADGIMSAAMVEVEAYGRMRAEETRVRIDRMREQELQSSELEVRRIELGMRRELLERAEALARERLTGLPRARNEPLLRALLSGHPMPGGRVFSNERDEPLVRALTSLRFAGHVKCLGGVVLESQDGTVKEDRTFDTILRETSERALPAIAGILFEEGG